MKPQAPAILLLTVFLALSAFGQERRAVIRTNQLGYLPGATKVAVYLGPAPAPEEFRVVNVFSGEPVFRAKTVPTGPLGQMAATARLDFSSLVTPGSYRIVAGDACSETFPIGPQVYDGAADFVLHYMRQQRCGWNPFLRDSCHTKDAIIVYHPTKSGQHLDVRGGWHDASDCLQYTATTANAIYQMAYAYERNPEAFADAYGTDGTPGGNGIPDIVDEIRWGLDWLDRMNPAPGEFYNQLADDRDHVGMRRPPEDQADYGWGRGGARPVYFCTGKPQQRGRHGGVNATTGIASTAGKFASAFGIGSRVLEPFYPELAARIRAKAADAWATGEKHPGVCQTVSIVSPYIYEEDNWTDDMELAGVEMYRLTGERTYLKKAIEYGRAEPVTPWMGADSARHYQWYPFMNMGHVRLAGEGREEFIRNLRSGIDRVWDRAQGSPFLYGIPSIWCSNNLTAAMLSQCILYRQLTGDRRYEEMEGALRDWLLGCNPWGVSMVVELPRGGVYPLQPHSFIINEKLGNTTGGLVDGPVYDTIFGSLLGIHTDGGNNYEAFQPGRMVYHDSTHDYSTNEPTMDGTASLTFPLSAYQMEGRNNSLPASAGVSRKNVFDQGGIVRTDPSQKRISLVFTAADKADGAPAILSALRRAGVKGAFFFTGEFFEKFPSVVRDILADGHYVGSHSYGHLLYCPWGKGRDSLLVSRAEFEADLVRSYAVMAPFGITPETAPLFMPPYEHYNATIASWARSMGLQVVNYTGGTYTNGDYTTPDMTHYYSSKFILDKVFSLEEKEGLNGHILLIHLGTVPERTDKFYNHLPRLIRSLQRRGYEFVPLQEAIR
ncbi:MAG: glycoside hydrolase family 9 protein [Bacteroidales bacterium]|nr:glycoside hydrolase family 9 protein [Bacteroidales bacterium]